MKYNKGPMVTAVNSIDNRRDNAPSLTRSPIAAPITLLQAINICAVQPKSKLLLIGLKLIHHPAKRRMLAVLHLDPSAKSMGGSRGDGSVHTSRQFASSSAAF
jgi:hypothetical protein